MAMTPYAALLARMRAEPSTPLVTYRHLGTGERMELSAASVTNAIAKTAGLLRDELDAGPGSMVGIHLPFHWQRVVWLGACAATGAVFAPGASPRDSDVCVVDREHLDLAGQGAEDVVVSLAPFGLPEPGGAPSGIIDAAVAMRAHPDVFVPDTVPTESAALIHQGDATWTNAAVMEHALAELARRGTQSGERFAIIDPDPLADVLAFAGPLAHGGGSVLVAAADRGDLGAVLREEGVARTAG